MGPSLVALIILSMTIGSYESYESVKINVMHTWKYPEFVPDSQQENFGIYDPYKCFLYDGDKANSKLITDYSKKL